MHLGLVLDENLVQPRLNIPCGNYSDSGDDESTNNTKISSTSQTTLKKTIQEFDQWERKVW